MKHAFRLSTFNYVNWILPRSKAQATEPTSPRKSRSETVKTWALALVCCLEQNWLASQSFNLLKRTKTDLEIAIAQTHASGVFPTPERPSRNKLLVLYVGISSRIMERTSSVMSWQKLCRHAKRFFAATNLFFLSWNVTGYSAMGGWLHAPAVYKIKG